MERIQGEHKQQLQKLAAELSWADPLQVLARGYGMVSNAPHGAPIQSAKAVEKEQPLFVEFIDGMVHCRVEDIKLTDKRQYRLKK